MAAAGEDGVDHSSDQTDALAAEVEQALASGEALQIVGAGTKSFYGRATRGRPLEAGKHTGIVAYEPSELVITARTGTPLEAVETLLADHGQMLAFEPPWFGEAATIGGTVACNFSGPRRPYAGSARDFVLGTRVINGRGEVLRFGGEVMKNVAGYDVSRLMTGALGTLGVLLEVSLKVLPAPERESTRCLEVDAGRGVRMMNELAGRPLPLSGAAWVDGRMYVRLSGSDAGVASATAEIGGDELSAPESRRFWTDLGEQRLPYFCGDRPLWRLSVPPATDVMAIDGDWLVDWGGAQRWVRTVAAPDQVRRNATDAGGHATAFRGGDRAGDIFHPLEGAMLALHQRIKTAMDPQGIFNPGRMYAGL